MYMYMYSYILNRLHSNGYMQGIFQQELSFLIDRAIDRRDRWRHRLYL